MFIFSLSHSLVSQYEYRPNAGCEEFPKQTNEKKPMKASDFHLMDTVRATCVAAFPNGHKNVNVTRLPRAECVCGRLFLLTVFFLLIRFSFPLRRKMNRTFSLTSLVLPRLSTSRREVAEMTLHEVDLWAVRHYADTMNTRTHPPLTSPPFLCCKLSDFNH